MTEARPRVEMVFVGKCVTTDGKQGWELSEFNGTERSKTRVYDKCRGVAMPVGPGTIWSVEYTPETRSDNKLTIFPATFRLERSWPVAEDRLKWQAIERAADETRRSELAEKRVLADSDELGQTIDQLRAAYTALPYSTRPAFLAFVVRRILRGKGE